MGKQRESNFELLRILLMIAIPLYHLMLYGGMNNLPFNKLTIPSLLICSGGAIVADYAFMSLSAYFLINGRGRAVISRFFVILFQVIFIYAIKMSILRVGLKITGENALFEAFLVKGSWWFIYVYLIVLLIYPFLNKLISQLKLEYLRLICILLGGWFIFNGIVYNANLLNDFVSFIFVYFVIGYLNRTNYEKYLCFNIKNKNMILIYVIGYLITFVCCLGIKWYGSFINNDFASEIVRNIIGRYSFIQFIMGIAVFLLFKNVSIKRNKWINNLAKNTFYVFLLHETVMAIFWQNNLLKIVDDKVPYESVFSLIIWCFVYIICSFVFAILVRFIYERIFKLYTDKVMSFICNTKFVKNIERRYQEL